TQRNARSVRGSISGNMRPRKKVPVISSRTAALIVATVGTVFIPSTGHAAQTVLGCPGTVQAGDQFTIAVTVDVAATCTAAVDCGMGWTCASGKCTTALGAYGITLTYDPNVVTIASVAGGDTSEFSSTPTSNTGVPGTTNVSSFQSSSLMAPTGLVSVAKVTVDAVAAASTSASIGLTVRYLYDTNSNLILPSTE